MLVIRLLLLLTFFTANVSALAFAKTFENIHLFEYESEDTFNYDTYKSLVNLPELRTERFSNPCIRLKPEVFYRIDSAKLALLYLQTHEVRFHSIKIGKPVVLKLPRHFISFQFHSFP